jgi:hypothetical protein
MSFSFNHQPTDMNRFFIACAILLASCAAPRSTSVASCPDVNIPVNGKLFHSVFMQNAAEYRALCFQAYNVARLRVDEYMQKDHGLRRPAIVTDIDETVLDNSRFTVHQGLVGKDYDPESWNAWTSMAAADSIPGACSFLLYAKSKGFDIFYITNRDEKDRRPTLVNLQKFGFPDSDSTHLFTRANTSSKEERRLHVAQTHEIVLLLGDNLADFSSLFDKKTQEERKLNTDGQSADFGNRFIVLPNASYGDWEPALYRYQKYSPARKDSLIRAVLKGY